MKKNIKKIIVTAVIALIILVLFALVYNSLFSSSNSTRYEGIEQHKLTKKEINAVEDKLKELEKIDNIDIHINSKIIKIVVNLEEDIDFEEVKKKSNEAISGFKEKNLNYYDIEIFIQSSNKESEIYPQIGYKFKTNSEFSW